MGADQSKVSDDFEIINVPNDLVTIIKDDNYVVPDKYYNSFNCSEKSYDVPKIDVWEEPVKIVNEWKEPKTIIKRDYTKELNRNYDESLLPLCYDDNIPDFKELNKKKYKKKQCWKQNYHINNEVHKRFNDIINLKNFNQLELYLRNLISHYRKSKRIF